LPALESLAGGRLLYQPMAGLRPTWHPLDARLGLPGLPQSGTGQTTILTGRNAPAEIGEHYGPYPNARLRELLTRHALWRPILDAGLRATFANAYPERYLARAGTEGGRMGAFARSVLLAGLELRGPQQLKEGRAVSAFLTHRLWRERLGHLDLPDIDEAEAGRRLAALAGAHDFCAFEYYATDIAGHRPERLDPVRALESLDRFVGGLLETWSEPDVLIVASDHGNIEDERDRRHSRNPALCIWRGQPPASPLASLTDLAPGILSLLGVEARR
jgi:hypothetical protein